MNTSTVSPRKVEEKFSPLKFAVIITLSVTGVIFLSRWCLLKTAPYIWTVQIKSVWWKYLLIFFVSQFRNCHAEWFFHRYVLHAPLVPFLRLLFVKHHWIHHISHTNVIPLPKGWKNEYPIINEAQYEASYFPWWTYFGFFGFASGIIAFAQFILPTFPIVLVEIFSIAWSLVVYEILHMIWHFPEEWWKSAINRFGKVAEVVYSFHLYHHAHIKGSPFKANEAISGFVCGLPLADLMFGTWKRCKVLWNGEKVDVPDLEVPVPHFWFIRKLDELAEQALERYARQRSARRQPVQV